MLDGLVDRSGWSGSCDIFVIRVAWKENFIYTDLFGLLNVCIQGSLLSKEV